MSYAIGMAQTQGLKEYLVDRLGVDTAYMSEFIKGLNEGANAGDNKKKAAYYAGIQIGQQIANQMVKGINHEVFGEDSTKTISMKNFMAGFVAGTTEHFKVMDMQTATANAKRLIEAIKTRTLEVTYADNKKAGEKYLAENAKKEGVVTLPSGVQYKVLTKGTGALPTDSSVVKVNYEGKLIDGTKFDSSYDRNQPLEVNMATPRVIPGWVEVLKLMPAGSVWEVTIPQEQAYGMQNQGQIKPFSTLIFKMEVLK
jgi:FKBP-type peptidyl-prolyl cis-trans isomerase FklB